MILSTYFIYPSDSHHRGNIRRNELKKRIGHTFNLPTTLSLSSYYIYYYNAVSSTVLSTLFGHLQSGFYAHVVFFIMPTTLYIQYSLSITCNIHVCQTHKWFLSRARRPVKNVLESDIYLTRNKKSIAISRDDGYAQSTMAPLPIPCEHVLLARPEAVRSMT